MNMQVCTPKTELMMTETRDQVMKQGGGHITNVILPHTDVGLIQSDCRLQGTSQSNGAQVRD